MGLIREHFLHTGTPKRRYDTRAHAEAAIAYSKTQEHAYRCKFCGGWHRATNAAVKAKARKGVA